MCLLVCTYCSADTSAFLLQKALDVIEKDAAPIIEAVYWLESAYVLDSLNTTTAQRMRAASGYKTTVTPFSSHTKKNGAEKEVISVTCNLLKNAGLAYMHLVRSAPLPNGALPLPQKDMLHTISTGLLRWPEKEK